jgi:hypothetical protein
VSARHPATVSLLRWLTPNPNLPTGTASAIAAEAEVFAARVVHAVPDGPELTAGLRKLLEAKDCFVRAALDSEADR